MYEFYFAVDLNYANENKFQKLIIYVYWLVWVGSIFQKFYELSWVKKNGICAIVVLGLLTSAAITAWIEEVVVNLLMMEMPASSRYCAQPFVPVMK